VSTTTDVLCPNCNTRGFLYYRTVIEVANVCCFDEDGTAHVSGMTFDVDEVLDSGELVCVNGHLQTASDGTPGRWNGAMN
jgi:hypothetical protein